MIDNSRVEAFRRQLQSELRENILPFWMRYAPDVSSRMKLDQWKCPYHNSRMCSEVMPRLDHSAAQRPAEGIVFGRN